MMEMPLLLCRCCGGELHIDREQEQIVCDYCGKRWGLAALLSDTPPLVGGEKEPLHTELQIYYYAIKRLHASNTVEACMRLAADFETTPELPDGAALTQACREKVVQLRQEQLYLGAMARMHSADPAEVEQAIQRFRQLGTYKDAAQRCAEAERLLPQVRARDAQRHRAKKRKWIGWASLILAVVLLFSLVDSWVYGASRLSVSIVPDTDALITEEYGDYVFHYAVTVMNRGIRGIETFTADVTLEDRQGNSLAEATLHPISGTVRSLRPGEKQSLSWAVSVESVETARRLAENAETVRIRVSIRQIVYTNGKVKNY